jgi:hypothetical protein
MCSSLAVATDRNRSSGARHVPAGTWWCPDRPDRSVTRSTSALADALNGHPAGADVAFVTCGGKFDPQAKQSEDNTVVFASVVR